MKTVFVGLSGGVDSAVSAYLLKKAGYDVTGVFLKVWEPDFLACTGPEDKLSAMRVAAHLEIPFRTYNLEEEYKRGVVDYFIEEYRAGRTPNPDVMCNREIKFGAFWQQAKQEGADMIATGHYARNENLKGMQALMCGKDEGKDQSYFLWTLTQDDLSHSLFPIGDMPKSEVRKIAEEAGLPNYARKDSQGLCFLGHVDMGEFLKHFIPTQQGIIRTTSGKEIGKHDGATFHTIGERLSIATGERMYVVSKDIPNSELIVSHELSLPEYTRSVVHLEKVNWVREAPQADKTYQAQLRYHGEKHRVKIQVNSVQFEEPTLITPGQSLVVYDPETNECLGGGIMGSNANHR